MQYSFVVDPFDLVLVVYSSEPEFQKILLEPIFYNIYFFNNTSLHVVIRGFGPSAEGVAEEELILLEVVDLTNFRCSLLC